MSATDEVLTIKELSDFIKVPVPTLYRWRHEQYGPPASKAGNHLRYLKSGVLRWLESQQQAGAA